MENKETLEEFAFEKYPRSMSEKDSELRNIFLEALELGVKWQAERMYSEEDLKHLEWIYGRLVDVHNENPNYDYILKLKSIIEKFKNK